jgi:hypothetical protein
MNWTIINSIDLAKIYPLTDTKLFVSDNFVKKKELTQFFNSFEIPYYLTNSKNSINDIVYFGNQTHFQSLYILAGILKSYSFVEMFYNSSLKEKITLGSIKRKTISQNYISVPIKEILDLAFDTSFEEFSRTFNLNGAQKIDLNEYYIQNGWEIPQENAELSQDSEENEEEERKPTFEDTFPNFDELDTNRDNYIDPYENFHWGGLSGEEAYIGYWNTE